MPRFLQSPAKVHAHLSGAEYPIDKDGLLEVAQRNNAPTMVLRALEGLPEREYVRASDVLEAMEANEQ